MRRLWPLFALLFSLTLAQVDLKATVVGTGLGWEMDRFEV